MKNSGTKSWNSRPSAPSASRAIQPPAAPSSHPGRARRRRHARASVASCAVRTASQPIGPTRSNLAQPSVAARHETGERAWRPAVRGGASGQPARIVRQARVAEPRHQKREREHEDQRREPAERLASCPGSGAHPRNLTQTPACAGPFQARDGGRTRDLRLGKPTLYQLSYSRAVRAKRSDSANTLRPCAGS